jgi:penicillin-binding protein 1A
VTLEPRFQQIAEKHLSDLVQRGSIQAEYEAGAVMMTGEGRVRAMIGGVDWSQRQFNNAVKSSVQPGSTAKLAVLVAACEAGKKPESRVVGLPLADQWPSNGLLGYKGETTLAEAVASSRNAAAVQLTRELGVRKVADVSRRLGLEPGPNPDVGFVLGSFSASVIGMTAAYAAVANGGYRVTPSGVLAVVDGRGHVRANYLDPPRTRAIPERCVGPTRRVLSEVVQSGTGRGARLGRWKAYGKTGTTTGNADAWFIGWSEGRVLGIWMGKRRDAGGDAVAGKGAPADLFRLVSNSANEMMDYRAGRGSSPREPQDVAEHRPKAPSGPTPPRKLAQSKRQAGPEPLHMHTAPPSLQRLHWDDECWPEDEAESFGPW